MSVEYMKKGQVWHGLLNGVHYLVVRCVVFLEYLFVCFRRTVGNNHNGTVTLWTSPAVVCLPKTDQTTTVLAREDDRPHEPQLQLADLSKGYGAGYTRKLLNYFKILIFVMSAFSVVMSRPWSRDSSALEFILSRSRSRSRDLMAKSQSWSRDLKSKVSVLVSRPKKGLDNNTVCIPRYVYTVEGRHLIST